MFGTRRATPCPDCIDRLKKHYSQLAEGWFLARKAAWSLSGCMGTNRADYYVLINEWVCQSHKTVIKATSGHRYSFGVRAWTEIEIRCIKGMCGLNVV